MMNMAFALNKLVLFALLITYSECFNPKAFNVSMFRHGYHGYYYGSNWLSAGATWYGSPTGAGSDGGACGYGDLVGRPPFSGMVSAGGPSIYQSGQGCGVCYEVKCTEHEACSGNVVTVTITDSCPGCTSDSAHFDLSGTAFGAMAKPNQADQLRNAGVLRVEYNRVECNYPGVTVEVRVDQGSNPYYFASTIQYTDGKGLQYVELKQQDGEWVHMDQSWGAVWRYNAGYVLRPPFSIRLTEVESEQTIVMDNVIPVGWQPGKTYRSHVNFN